jgi:hypothetical protein
VEGSSPRQSTLAAGRSDQSAGVLKTRSLNRSVWKPLIKCGQQSLEVFAVGIYLSLIGYFILTTTSDGIIAQLLVGTAGIATMTAVAYYRSWSKRVEKAAHAHVSPPIVDKSHAIADELARPAERAVVGVA